MKLTVTPAQLEACNNWQILRAEILARNPDMALTIQELDMMVERSARAAMNIAHRIDWDFSEAARIAEKENQREAK
ncbi:Uncharacterised protein [Cedecea lapagei]|uniref:Uncharacterized protein n=1 Tax=Cedecea lapagei TaxID=158823 RepID=A0A3S4JBI8_9ENTR|nr:hypothetical protein [Cedecea lapagei]VEB97388.1 Uncharacterised protein [Cedecea lapagei]